MVITSICIDPINYVSFPLPCNFLILYQTTLPSHCDVIYKATLHENCPGTNNLQNILTFLNQRVTTNRQARVGSLSFLQSILVPLLDKNKHTQLHLQFSAHIPDPSSRKLTRSTAFVHDAPPASFQFVRLDSENRPIPIFPAISAVTAPRARAKFVKLSAARRVTVRGALQKNRSDPNPRRLIKFARSHRAHVTGSTVRSPRACRRSHAWAAPRSGFAR